MKLWQKLALTLNVLLLGFVVWLACAGPGRETPLNFPRYLANRLLRVKQVPSPPLSSIVPVPEVVEVSEPFDWAQLESTDYRVYVANLRAIGCPEPTVRDLIIADVNDLFAPRVKALVDEVTGNFWELILHKEAFGEMVDEKHSQLRALGEERDEVFIALFGASNPRSAEDLERYATDGRAQWERTADFLPEEKRSQFVAAKEELERAWTDFLRTPGLTGLQSQAKRKELEAAYEQALREKLTTDEYHKLRLRQSPAASLRDRLAGLDWNEATVRAVANLQFAQAEAQAALSEKDADFKSRTAQFKQASEAHTRELLGDDRYAALQRAIDHRYEPIYRVTQRLGLPDAAAAQAYDIRGQAEDAANRVRANESLLAEEQQTLLHVIGAETRQSLSAALGPKGLAAYEKIDGGWMPQFTVATP
jgi:hypothetical protein